MTRRMKWLGALFVTALATTSVANAGVLYYGGNYDPNLGGLISGYPAGLQNLNSSLFNRQVYDNFTINDAGWHISELFSNDFIDQAPVQSIADVHWEIRSGVSAGNGGTVVAQGDAAPSTFVPTGRTFTGSLANVVLKFAEYNIIVSTGDIILGPGTYWLSVQVVDSGVTDSVESATSGQNGIGIHTKPDDDFQSFVSNFNFADTSTFTPPYDTFSDGVVGGVCSQIVGNPRTGFVCIGGSIGTDSANLQAIEALVAVPEPSSLSLVLMGLFGLAGLWLRVRRPAQPA